MANPASPVDATPSATSVLPSVHGWGADEGEAWGAKGVLGGTLASSAGSALEGAPQVLKDLLAGLAKGKTCDEIEGALMDMQKRRENKTTTPEASDSSTPAAGPPAAGGAGGPDLQP